jgi:hypothetical protein
MTTTDQPSRVSPADIVSPLRDMAALRPDTPLAEQLAWHERKAQLLSQIAAGLDTAEAYLAASDAWHQCGQLARCIRSQEDQT